MKEIFSTSDPGETAFLKSIFAAADIPLFLFDEHLSGMLGGLGGGFAPCRLMVSDSDYETACEMIDEYLELAEKEEKS